jgi:hypothetical protein
METPQPGIAVEHRNAASWALARGVHERDGRHLDVCHETLKRRRLINLLAKERTCETLPPQTIELALK